MNETELRNLLVEHARARTPLLVLFERAGKAGCASGTVVALQERHVILALASARDGTTVPIDAITGVEPLAPRPTEGTRR